MATFANGMQRHCREITLATIAQSLNVVGLIMVDEQGMWREPTYRAWHMATHHHGSLALDAWPEVDTFSAPEQRLSDLPYLDASVTLDPGRRQLYLPLVNRHHEQAVELGIQLTDAVARAGGRAFVLYHDDPQAMNGHDRPDNVRTREQTFAQEDSRIRHEVLPHSYTILQVPLGD